MSTSSQLSEFAMASAPTFILFTAMPIAVIAVLIKFCANKKTSTYKKLV